MSTKKSKRKIRVGLIRCDTHGLWYGPLFEKHDPLLFRQSLPYGKEMKQSWQRGGCWYYFYTYYNDPKRFTAEHVSGFELVKLWDANRELAETTARIFYDKPRVCTSFDEVSDDVDLVFLADCNGDGSDHLKLATPGLKKGVPTFLDKPFAYTLPDAYKLLDLAANKKTPMMSLSMMRTAPSVARFRSRLAETGGIDFGSVYGGSTIPAGLIHSMSLVQGAFGNGVQSVQAMPGSNQTLVHLDYGGRRDRPVHGITINCDVGPTFHSAFYLSAIGPRRKIDSHDIGDWENPFSAAEVLKRVRKMVRTGKPTEPANEMVECVALAQACRESLKKGKPVDVPALLRRTGGAQYIIH